MTFTDVVLSRFAGDAASVLPGPPQSTADLAYTLAGADLMEWGARRGGEVAGTVAGPAGRLQTVKVAEQQPVGLSLDLAVGQEADSLLDAVGVTVASRHWARGQASLLLLLEPVSQI